MTFDPALIERLEGRSRHRRRPRSLPTRDCRAERDRRRSRIRSAARGRIDHARRRRGDRDGFCAGPTQRPRPIARRGGRTAGFAHRPHRHRPCARLGGTMGRDRARKSFLRRARRRGDLGARLGRSEGRHLRRDLRRPSSSRRGSPAGRRDSVRLRRRRRERRARQRRQRRHEGAGRGHRGGQARHAPIWRSTSSRPSSTSMPPRWGF